jgi:hypothetical protein
MRLLIISGSDAGISAALRVRELRPDVEVPVVLADAFPTTVSAVCRSTSVAKAKTGIN